VTGSCCAALRYSRYSFWSIFRVVMGFLGATGVESRAALFVFPALFGIGSELLGGELR
jgi:hypothetical protein